MKRDPNCTRCELHESSTHVCIAGIGNRTSKVMLIGEAPGAREAKTGKPFQGQSGQLLRQELRAVGIDPDEVFITNMVGCRPPDNRTPSAAEMKACRPYLDQEILEVDPDFVLLLGATALKYIKKTGITDLRGSVHDVNGRKFMPVFHPAAALRDPGRLPAFREDLAKFARLINGELKEQEEIDWYILDKENCEVAFEEMVATEVFSFDIETTGLQVRSPTFDLNSISFSLDNERTWVLPLRKGADRVWADWAFKQCYKRLKNRRAVGHNGKFDNMGIMAVYGVRFHLAFDTMLASHVFDENSPHDLKFLARVILGAPDYDDLTVKQKIGLVVVDLERYCRYNALDTHYTLQLYYHYRDKFKRVAGLRRLFYKLVMPAARIFEEIDFNGLPIDLDKLEETQIDLQARLERAERELQQLSGSKRKINWGSPTQVAKILYGKHKLPCTTYTGKGKPSTSEQALIDLKGHHPIVDRLIEFRGYQKFLSTYVLGWQELMLNDRLYLSTKLHGTVTGRFSSRLHQVPRDGTIRTLVTAPEGYTFVCADFSQVEMRLAAEVSDDPRMKIIFQTGGDIHFETAEAITGKSRDTITKEERKKAKAVGFGFLYSMGAPKFRKYAKEKYDLDLTLEEATHFRNRFFDLYAALPKWHARMRRLVREQGYVEYLSGRLRRLPGAFSSDREVIAEAERQSINSPIQGFGSGDMKVMALIGIYERFNGTGLVQILGEVHDSILMLVKTGHEEQVFPEIKRLMENPPLFADFGIELSVPIVVDIEYGPAWGNGETWTPA